MESMETGRQQAVPTDTGAPAAATAQQTASPAAAQTFSAGAQSSPAGAQMMAPPAQAPAPLYPQHLAQQPQNMPLAMQQPQSVSPLNEAFTAGTMGMVIVGTGAMGANLHKVNSGEMELGEAFTDSLGKGAVGAVAAAGATYTAASLTTGGLLGLAVTVAAGTGISYLLSKQDK